MLFLVFAHHRGVARIFPWGRPNFDNCNLGEYPLPPPGVSHPGGVGTFPNYLNGYVPPNRVVMLERFRLLRNSLCRVASQPFFYCGTAGWVKPSNSGTQI